MTLGLAGGPLLVLGLGSIVIFSIPIWMAARIVGAANATLARSVASLLAGSMLAIFTVRFGGPFGWIGVPVAFLVAFKLLLGASWGEAFLLCVLAVLGDLALVKIFAEVISTHLGVSNF
jgi:hypothetical protein